jgi:hypothetical protein
MRNECKFGEDCGHEWCGSECKDYAPIDGGEKSNNKYKNFLNDCKIENIKIGRLAGMGSEYEDYALSDLLKDFDIEVER